MSDVIDIMVVLLTKGLGQTLLITTLSWILAIVVGVTMAMVVENSSRGWQRASFLGNTMLRGVPEIVAIYLLVYGLAAQGVRFSPLVAVVIALGVVQAAFAAQSFQGCLLLVSSGQRLAAESLGLSQVQAYLRVILPQALVAFAPAGLNVYVALLKLSTLASAVGISEMLYLGRSEIERRQEMIPATMALIIVYLLLTIPLTQIVRLGERRVRGGDPGFQTLRFV